jgi:hypothetical protein
MKVEVYSSNGNMLGEKSEMSRQVILQNMALGHIFYSMIKDRSGKWSNTKRIYNSNGCLKLAQDFMHGDFIGKLPLLLTKRKTFISYYHKDNEQDRLVFENLTTDLIVNKSVGANEILPDNSDEYVKQLIQNGYLHDTTVLVVLIGPKTKCRRHVDWEISGALNYKVGDIYAGIVGVILPSHPDFYANVINPANLPPRLAENFKSGYAKVYKWSDDRRYIQDYIEDAFSARTSRKDKRVNALPQMQKNTCD